MQQRTRLVVCSPPAYRAAVLAAGAWLASLALVPAASHAAVAGLEFRVNGDPGAAPRSFVALDDIVAELDASPNWIARRSGPAAPALTADERGTSARKVVALAGVDPDTLVGDSIADPAMVVGRGDGDQSALTRGEVLGGFPNPLEPPGFERGHAIFRQYNQDSLFYIRPLRTSGESGEYWQEGSPHRFVVDLQIKGAGRVLRVSARATPSTAKAGQPLEFTAVPDGLSPGWSFSWDFDDNTIPAPFSTEQRSTIHTFAEHGTYRVTVRARDGDDGGISLPLTVSVDPGEAPAGDDGDDAPPPGPAPGSAGSRRPPGSTTDPDAARTGTGTSDAGAASGRDRSASTRDVVGKDSGAASDRDATSPAGAPGRTTGSRGTSGARDGSGRGGSGQGAAGGSPVADRAARRAPGAGGGATPGRRGADGRGEVEGLLLEGAGDAYAPEELDAARLVALRRQQRAARPGQGSAGGGWPVWVGGALALVGLLCTGAALEQLPASRREVWA